MSYKKASTLEESLEILWKRSQKQSSLSLAEIVGDLSGKGRFILLLVLSVFFCQPLQIPGMSVPFGLVIAFIGIRMVFEKQVWLPKKILAKNVSAKKIQKIIEKFLKILKKLRRFLHPRMRWLSEHKVMKVVNGCVIVFLGLGLALPLPVPLTNIAAGWAIFFLALGLLEEDGIFVLLGYVGTLGTFLLLALIVFSLEELWKIF